MDKSNYNTFLRVMQTMNTQDIDMTKDDWIVATGIANNYGHGFEWEITDEEEMRKAIQDYIDQTVADREEEQ